MKVGQVRQRGHNVMMAESGSVLAAPGRLSPSLLSAPYSPKPRVTLVPRRPTGAKVSPLALSAVRRTDNGPRPDRGSVARVGFCGSGLPSFSLWTLRSVTNYWSPNRPPPPSEGRNAPRFLECRPAGSLCVGARKLLWKRPGVHLFFAAGMGRKRARNQEKSVGWPLESTYLVAGPSRPCNKPRHDVSASKASPDRELSTQTQPRSLARGGLGNHIRCATCRPSCWWRPPIACPGKNPGRLVDGSRSRSSHPM